MLSKEYKAHVDFKLKGKLPKSFPSTKSNFKRASETMVLNSTGTLLRNGKFVVRKSDRKAIFQGNFLANASTNLSLSQGPFRA